MYRLRHFSSVSRGDESRDIFKPINTVISNGTGQLEPGGDRLDPGVSGTGRAKKD